MTYIAEFTAGREKRGRSRPKGYVTDWKPHKATRALLDSVLGVLDEYVDYLPLTVRQVYYRLVGLEVIDKTDRDYVRLCEHLVMARRARIVPFDALRDDGVVTMTDDWYASREAFDDATARRARAFKLDRQDGQAVRMELWCEAAGMLPQLEIVASEYCVPVYSCGGFQSLTAVRQIVDRAARRNCPTVLLHVGDHDPSGVAVFDSMRADVSAFLEADRVLHTQEFRPVRVALSVGYQSWTLDVEDGDLHERTIVALTEGWTRLRVIRATSDGVLLTDPAQLEWTRQAIQDTVDERRAA